MSSENKRKYRTYFWNTPAYINLNTSPYSLLVKGPDLIFLSPWANQLHCVPFSGDNFLPKKNKKKLRFCSSSEEIRSERKAEHDLWYISLQILQSTLLSLEISGLWNEKWNWSFEFSCYTTLKNKNSSYAKYISKERVSLSSPKSKSGAYKKENFLANFPEFANTNLCVKKLHEIHSFLYSETSESIFRISGLWIYKKKNSSTFRVWKNLNQFPEF